LIIMDLGWILLLVGALFLLAEAAVPGFFAAVPGTILVIIGILLILVPDLLSYPWSPFLFAIITLVVSALTIAFYKRLAPGQKPFTTSMDSLAGKSGDVVKEIMPDSIDGKVKIDSQIWSATSDVHIGEGEKVTVVHVSGVHLFVKRVS
jgi:membrane protein implicated in regulation of membrane protease activity